MNIHLIYAHPNGESLNSALRDSAINVLKAEGHSVMLSDLYHLSEDGNAAVNSFFGAVSSEGKEAAVKQEQVKIKQAELTIVQFPLYWFGFPGILKNYFDQVFTKGFAYPGKFDTSPLHDGRRVMLSVTTQSDAKDFSEQGVNGDIQQSLYPLELGFRFVGYDISPAFVGLGVHTQTAEQLEQLRQNFEARLLSLVA